MSAGWTAEIYDQLNAIELRFGESCSHPGGRTGATIKPLEESLADKFAQYYLVLPGRYRPGARTPTLLPVEQDLTVSLPLWLRTFLKPVRPLLCQRLLMAGCIVGDGRIGVRALHEVPAVCGPLDEALSFFARRRQVRIILFKDYPAAYRPLLAGLTEAGPYVRLPSLPAVHLALRDASFEAFVQNRLGKATRKSLRRKLREVDAPT